MSDLNKLRSLAADNDPATTIIAARIADPKAAEVAMKVSDLMVGHFKAGGLPSATFILVSAVLGFVQASGMKDVKGAGEAAELMGEIMVKVLNHSIEQGFAASRIKGQGEGGK